jgi:apolipoprotein N-acyltransferase
MDIDTPAGAASLGWTVALATGAVAVLLIAYAARRRGSVRPWGLGLFLAMMSWLGAGLFLSQPNVAPYAIALGWGLSLVLGVVCIGFIIQVARIVGHKGPG